MKALRQTGIDAFRYPLALLVITIHVMPSATSDLYPVFGAPFWLVAIDALSRVAVPYFFMIAGFFFRPQANLKTSVAKVIARLMPIYLFWTAVYLAVAALFPGPWLPPAFRWLSVIEGCGVAYHLWFLPALIFGVASLAAAKSIGGTRLAVMTAVGFALVGPIYYDYHSALNLPEAPRLVSDLRRQLAAPAYVVIGYLLARRPSTSVRAGVFMAMLAFGLVLAERAFLWSVVGNHAISASEGLVSTFVFGAALLNLAHSLNGSILAEKASRLAPLSLPVYITHVFFLWAAQARSPDFDVRLWETTTIAAVGATLLSLLLLRSPLWFRRRYIS